MSVIKSVQFTYCVGYTMRGRSWNANGGWTEREVEEFKTGILGFLFKLSQ
jgi:hypothetical protein